MPVDRRRYGRTPDTVALLGFLVFTATSSTLVGEVSPAVAKIAPVWLALLWSGTFAVSAILALTGILWREKIGGLLIELPGRVGLAVTGTGFVVALWAGTSEYGASIAIGFVAAISVASGVRAWQIVKRLHELRTVVAS